MRDAHQVQEVMAIVEMVEGHACQPMLRTRQAIIDEVSDEELAVAIDMDIGIFRDIIDEAERMTTKATMRLRYGIETT